MESVASATRLVLINALKMYDRLSALTDSNSCSVSVISVKVYVPTSNPSCLNGDLELNVNEMYASDIDGAKFSIMICDCNNVDPTQM
jgi:hypothetical protein